jgi:hypothetical protein
VSDIFIGITVGVIIASLIWSYSAWRQHATLMDALHDNDSLAQRLAEATSRADKALLDSAFAKAEDNSVIARLERMIALHEIADQEGEDTIN